MSGDPRTVAIEIARLPGAEGLPLPSRATPGAAGYDLCAAVQGDVVLAPGERRLIPTGFGVAIPTGFEGQIRPRSGLALRHGVVLPNSPGTIDSDYRGELQVIIWNASSQPFSVARGDRIAQLVIAPVVAAEWRLVDRLADTERGDGGFGHTGRRTGRTP